MSDGNPYQDTRANEHAKEAGDTFEFQGRSKDPRKLLLQGMRAVERAPGSKTLGRNGKLAIGAYVGYMGVAMAAKRRQNAVRKRAEQAAKDEAGKSSD